MVSTQNMQLLDSPEYFYFGCTHQEYISDGI